MFRSGLTKICCLVRNSQSACATLATSTKLSPVISSTFWHNNPTMAVCRNFHGTYGISSLVQQTMMTHGFLLPKQSLDVQVGRRNVTKYSLKTGKRKSVKAVLKRFYRLDWGIWIRTKCGRGKKLYKKSGNRIRRLRQHVFTNATQSYLLDKMVTRYWRKPRFYPEDPYNPYHKREEFPLTRKLPVPPDT